jgi:hypothetical protein
MTKENEEPVGAPVSVDLTATIPYPGAGAGAVGQPDATIAAMDGLARDLVQQLGPDLAGLLVDILMDRIGNAGNPVEVDAALERHRAATALQRHRAATLEGDARPGINTSAEGAGDEP